MPQEVSPCWRLSGAGLKENILRRPWLEPRLGFNLEGVDDFFDTFRRSDKCNPAGRCPLNFQTRAMSETG